MSYFESEGSSQLLDRPFYMWFNLECIYDCLFFPLDEYIRKLLKERGSLSLVIHNCQAQSRVPIPDPMDSIQVLNSNQKTKGPIWTGTDYKIIWAKDMQQSNMFKEKVIDNQEPLV